MPVDLNQTRNWAAIIIGCAVVAAIVTLLLPPIVLPGISAYLYLLIELFTVFISILVVAVSYHSLGERPDLEHANLLILGFTVVAASDLAHALTYPGLPGYVQGHGATRTIFFRLMGRSAEVATLIAIASLAALPGRRNVWLGVGIGLFCIIGWFGVYRIDLFPEVIVNRQQTLFKTSYEYFLATLSIGAAFVLWRKAEEYQSAGHYLLSCSCVLMAGGNVVLAQYRTPADINYTLGQFFKVGAYMLVYRAAFVEAIKAPYRLLQTSEQQLRSSEQQLKTIGDNVPGGAVFQLRLSAEGRWLFTYFSAGILRITDGELSASDVMRDADALLSRLPVEDRQALLAAQRRSAQDMSVMDLVVRVRDAAGSLRHLHLCSQPCAQEDGALVWDGVAIDVTERERIQTELRKLNLELEQRVSQRTAALTHANRSLESFSYMIAHDLRAPLRHIDGFAGLLQQDHTGRMDQEARDMLAGIRRSTAAMYQMIDGILAVSKLEHAPLSLERVDLSEMVKQITHDLQTSDPHRTVQVIVQPQVAGRADPVLIKNVLTNLLSNAWKFTAASASARIEFGALKPVGAGPRAQAAASTFFVRDNGSGFAPEQANRLFDLFQRLPNHAHVAGHGIGLASVRSIIVNHGGEAWAEGNPGRGATFYFSLPDLQPQSSPMIEPDIVADKSAR